MHKFKGLEVNRKNETKGIVANVNKDLIVNTSNRKKPVAVFFSKMFDGFVNSLFHIDEYDGTANQAYTEFMNSDGCLDDVSQINIIEKIINDHESNHVEQLVNMVESGKLTCERAQEGASFEIKEYGTKNQIHRTIKSKRIDCNVSFWELKHEIKTNHS